ncbi:hypothetical protein D8911_12935 [Levilactobacillus brevis]|nr:hypothetical protein D8911_12935 [Levilactobacillus brevis]
MEPAVSTVLAEVVSQPTAWGDLRDSRFLRGFQANWKPAFWLEVSPIAGGTLGSRRHLVCPVFKRTHVNTYLVNGKAVSIA